MSKTINDRCADRCAICGSPTRWDAGFAGGAGSGYCERCGVWTAPADGLETKRRERFAFLCLSIARRLARQRIPA